MSKQLFNSVQYLSHELQWKETRSSRMADDPPYLTVGTEVSAKYKGAFYEAKIRKVVRVVKCKVTFKAGGGSHMLADDQIKGTIRIGTTVEAKHPEKNQYIEATINRIQDSSQYTVVFDDGDITTLRRSALCLKSGRHFNESETLDQLPLTHPEHFSNPVVGGRRGVRRRAADKDDSSEEEDEELPPRKDGKKKVEKELDMGKVVCVDSTDKKKGKDTWFPALVVSPSAQETAKIWIKDEYLVRSFRDGRYYTVPKKEISEFTKDSLSKYDSNSAPLRSAVDKALNFLEKNELPAHWDREVLFGNVRQSESGEGEEPQSDSEPEDDPRNEEKDRFIAQLYKFMDDRSTPLNKVPQVCQKDLDLHKLFKIVTGKGGYTKVTNQSQWKSATIKLGYGNMPSTSTINLVKQAYKKFLFNFEEFYRKLGCTWTPRSTASTSSSKSRSSRSIFRERGTPKSSSRESTRDKKEDEDGGRATPSSSTSSRRERDREAKEKEKSSEKSSPEEKEKPVLSSPEAESSTAGDTGSETSEKPNPKAVVPAAVADPPEEIRKSARGRQPKKVRDADESASPSASSRKKRQATASRDRDRDSSVASSTKDDASLPATPSSKDKEKDKEKEKEAERALATTPTGKRGTSGPSPGPGLASGRGKYRRHGSKGALDVEEKESPQKEQEEEKPVVEPPTPQPPAAKIPGPDIRLGDKLQVYYPKSEGKTYEAKVIDISEKNGNFLVQYTGWNNRYDEWIDKLRVSENITLKLEQSGEEQSSKAAAASASRNESGPGARGQGANKRKGRNSSSATSTTSASSGTTNTATPSTPSTTRSGKAAAAAAANLSTSPVSSKRRRSTSTEVRQTQTPTPKRRRTRQRSGPDNSGPPGQGSDSEGETSDSDGRSIKSEMATAPPEVKTPVSRKEVVTPTPTPTESKTTRKAAAAAAANAEDVGKATGKPDKKSQQVVEVIDLEDEISSSSVASTRSKAVAAAASVEDSKESSSSSSSTSNSGSGHVIDLDQIRSEMKGLDKMMKGSSGSATPSTVASPAPTTLSAAVGSSPSTEPSKMDVYEFQEDGADEDAAPAITPTAPKLKMFSPVARSTTSDKHEKEKGPVTVSASSAEVVAKLGSGSTHELQNKVPFVSIEKMDKDKASRDKNSSVIKETPVSSSEPASASSEAAAKSSASTAVEVPATESAKPTPAKASSAPVPPPLATPAMASTPSQGIPPPPLLASSTPPSVITPSLPSLTPASSMTPVILSTSSISMPPGLKGKGSPPVTATVMGFTPRVVSVMSAASVPPSSISTPPPPLLIPSAGVVSATPPAVTAAISSTIMASTITTPPPPVLQLQQHRPVITFSSPSGSQVMSSPSPMTTPERPVLTPIVAASVSGTPKVIASSSSLFPGRKQEAYPHLIQHSTSDLASTANIPTISIVAAKPSTAELTSPPQTSVLVTGSQPPLKIAATIPPPPPVVVKPPLKPGFGPGPSPGSDSGTSKPKKKKAKTSGAGQPGSPAPVKTLAPLPTVGAPPPPPVVIQSSSTSTTTSSATPTPGRKTPVKKRIPPPMDSPVKPVKPLGLGLATPPVSSKPGKMNSEAMNAAIASVGATPTPPSMSVPTTVITPTSTIFQTHPGSPGVLFATTTTQALANQPPPPPVNLLKSNLPAPIKSSSESIAASIAAVASMGSTSSPRTTTTVTTSSSTGKSTPMKRFMKETAEKPPIMKDKVFTFGGLPPHQPPPPPISSTQSLSLSYPPPPIVIGKSPEQQLPPQQQQQQPPPPPITIQAKFQPTITSIGSTPVTFVKGPVSSGPPPPMQCSHHLLEPHGQHHQLHSKSNLAKHPVIIIPAAPVVIKPAPYQHQQQPPPPQQQQPPPHHLQPVIVPKPATTQLQLESHHHISTSTSSSGLGPILVTTPSSSGMKPMLPITVTPSAMQMGGMPMSIQPYPRGNLPAVELKPVMSLPHSSSMADLPSSITVTKATTVMKSISPDIVAVSSYSSPMKSSTSNTSVFTPLKQEDRMVSGIGREPEIIVKPAPASAQIVFHTETKKGLEPIQHHQPPPPMRRSSDVKEPDENSLLCEEIIPGSPTAGDGEDKGEETDSDPKDVVKREQDVTMSISSGLPGKSLLHHGDGGATPPSSSGGTTPSVSGSGKPVIVLGPKYGEDVLDDDRDRISFVLEEGRRRRMSRFGLEQDDDDDDKLMEERSVDSPMGPPSEGREADLQFRDSFSDGDGDGDHSPPSSPSTTSTISTDDSERRHDSRRLSPTPEGGSSKSKDSDDDDMDSDVGSKSTHLDDGDSKHGSTRGSTRIRNQTSRLGRSPSPPNKRRRTNRRGKSPEEGMSRGYVGRTIRTSSGRKVTPVGRHGSDSYMDREREREMMKEKEEKKPPPPPPVNLAKPPKTGRYNFIPNLSGMADADQRIGLISQAINDLKEQYQKTKTEAASFDRRVKRWKRRVREKERLARQEATKAAS